MDYLVNGSNVMLHDSLVAESLAANVTSECLDLVMDASDVHFNRFFGCQDFSAQVAWINFFGHCLLIRASIRIFSCNQSLLLFVLFVPEV